MHISDEFILRDIAGDYIIVPTGKEAMEFQGLITVNEVGAFLWAELQKKDLSEKELIAVLLKEYDVDQETATNDVNEFLSIVRNRGMLKDEE